MLYDQQNSFKTLKDWIDELREKGPEGIAICIAGNKRDLEAQREVETETAQAYAEEIGAMFSETSAKDDLNVQKIFVDLSEWHDKLVTLMITCMIRTNGKAGKSNGVLHTITHHLMDDGVM